MLGWLAESPSFREFLLKELSVLKERGSTSNGGSATDFEQGADGLREREIAEENQGARGRERR